MNFVSKSGKVWFKNFKPRRELNYLGKIHHGINILFASLWFLLSVKLGSIRELSDNIKRHLLISILRIIKKHNNVVVVILFIVGFSNTLFAQTQTVFSTNGTSTFTVPAGVTSIRVQCWGAGGAGGGASGSLGSNVGAGGGGGAYNSAIFNVIPTNNYTVTVGKGGAGVSAGKGGNGTASSISGAAGTVSANPGTGGTNDGGAIGQGGTGGTASGGNGGSGSSNGAGGGGAAGSGVNYVGTTGGTGANTGTASGGTGTYPGGAGGAAKTSSGNGNTGSSPGGGGGGANVNLATAKTGGAGADGEVIISYYLLTSVTAASSICPASTSAFTINASTVNLPTGNYTVTYNLSGANTATGNTAPMNVTTAGQGTFTTSALTNAGVTTVSVTQLQLSTSSVIPATGTNSGNVTVNATNTAGVPSSTPALCVNSILANITIATTGATGIGIASSLPSGVTAAWATNVITISGTPIASGTFSYSIPLTGGCGSVNATGTITVNPLPTAVLAVNGQTNASCYLSNGSITVAGSGGSGTITGYSVFNGIATGPPLNLPAYQSSPTFSLPAGSYQLRVKDSNGCESKQVH